jgi:hypothetical protein
LLTEREGLFRAMSNELLDDSSHLGFITATGRIISSREIPPCWKLSLY